MYNLSFKTKTLGKIKFSKNFDIDKFITVEVMVHITQVRSS